MFFFFYSMHEQQYSLKMRFEERDKIGTLDLFIALSLAEEAAQELSSGKKQIHDRKGLFVNRIELNSPLKLDLIVTGFGAVFLLVQIFDKIKSWEKLSLEKENLKLENEILRSKLAPAGELLDESIEPVLSKLEKLEFKLDALVIDRLDDDQG